MKKLFLFICIALGSNITSLATKPTPLSEADFSRLISDYSTGYAGWNFKGKRPAVIDFYADWCGPCKALSPTIDSLATVYNGKVDFYKVNVDQCPNLARKFGIRSIPMLLFCPVGNTPQTVVGVYPGSELDNVIRYLFFPKK